MSDYCYCDGEGRLDSHKISRRGVLATGLMAGVTWMASPSAWAQASFSTKVKDGNVLVVVFLRGGADGLNVVSPYAEDDYYRLRPTLAIASPNDRSKSTNDRLIKLDDHFGLNPAMRSLEGAFHEGRLGFIHACGSQDETRSHFEAMGTMERGLATRPSSSVNGWLARHLADSPPSSSPLRAVAISNVMPDSLSGAIGAVTVPSLDQYRLAEDNPETRERLRRTLSDLYRGHSDVMGEAGHRTLQVLERLEKVEPADYKPDNGASYPQNELGEALRQVALLVKLGVGLEVACLDAMGWDTHVAQGATSGWLTGLLSGLADALAAFDKDLGTAGSRVTVVVQTEFGRRIEENAGFGTDHGRGGVMMVLGAGVNGGRIHGKWPTLRPQEQVGPGDLPVTTDYRSVLSEVLKTRFGRKDSTQVFPEFNAEPVGVMRA